MSIIMSKRKYEGEVARPDSRICNSLVDSNISETMIDDIQESIKLKKEIGYNIDKDFNITDRCIGRQCNIKLKKPKEPFGNFHTHPGVDASSDFSPADLRDTFKKGYNFSCVGIIDRSYYDYGYVNCIEVNKNDEYKELKNKEKEFDKILKEYKKADSKTKLKMLQEKKLSKNGLVTDILNFMNKQKTCLIRYVPK